MAEPKIFTKNYVSGDCQITVSHGDGSKANAYDRDNSSKWMSSGANDDATTVSMEVAFYEGSVAVDREIDSFFLINHNLKNWALTYWDGSAWQALASESADAAATTFKSFVAVTTSKIKLECDETQVADAEKYVGEIIACALQLDIGIDLEVGDYVPQFREMSKEITLGDGSIHKMVTIFGQSRTQKYQARATFRFLSESLRDSLKAIREAGEPFLWQPESVTRPDEVYLVHWVNSWNERYVAHKGAGSEIQMDLKEV